MLAASWWIWMTIFCGKLRTEKKAYLDLWNYCMYKVGCLNLRGCAHIYPCVYKHKTKAFNLIFKLEYGGFQWKMSLLQDAQEELILFEPLSTFSWFSFLWYHLCGLIMNNTSAGILC